MKLQVTFDDYANKAATRYQLFLQNILAAYNRTLLQGRINFKSLKSFENQVRNYATNYLDAETSMVNETFNFIIDQIEALNKDRINPLESDEWYNYLKENANFLYDAIKLQVDKDILYAINFFRSKVIHIISLNDFQAAYELINNSRELSFFYIDKIGRKVNSVKYIRTVTRSFLVTNYNDLVVGSAMVNGIETVIVDHLDEGHKHNGIILTINENDSYNYFKLRDEIFHPNSNAIVRIGT